MLVTVCGAPLDGDNYTIKYFDANGNEWSVLDGPGVYEFVIEPANGNYVNSYRSYSSNEITIFEGNELHDSYYYDKYNHENVSFYVNGQSEYSGSTNQWSGLAIDPMPVVKVGNTVLKEGVDYVVDYRQTEYSDGYQNRTTTIVPHCIENGHYTVNVTGYGEYAGMASRTFSIVKPENDYSNAEVYVVKGGMRTALQETYAYTGSNVLDGTLEFPPPRPGRSSRVARRRMPNTWASSTCRLPWSTALRAKRLPRSLRTVEKCSRTR